MTERGFRWTTVSILLALAADALLFAVLLMSEQGGVGSFQNLSLALQSWEVLLLASAVPGYLGFRALRAGREEFGPAHARSGRRGTLGFFVGASAAVLSFATGLILGFIYVPVGAYTAGSTPSQAWYLILGDSIRGIHLAAPALIAPFAGIFLLGFAWSLSSGLPRGLAAAAFVLGIAAPIVGLVSFELQAFPSASVALGLEALPAVSLALWAVVYLLIPGRLRGSVLAPKRNASSA